MIRTLSPSGLINENLIKCKYEHKGKFYVVDIVGNVYETEKRDYEKIGCKIKHPLERLIWKQ